MPTLCPSTWLSWKIELGTFSWESLGLHWCKDHSEWSSCPSAAAAVSSAKSKKAFCIHLFHSELPDKPVPAGPGNLNYQQAVLLFLKLEGGREERKKEIQAGQGIVLNLMTAVISAPMKCLSEKGFCKLIIKDKPLGGFLVPWNSQIMPPPWEAQLFEFCGLHFTV